MHDITVTQQMTLEEIAEAFSQRFPFLKLEFFAKPHKEDRLSPAKERLDPELTIAEASQFDHAEVLSIHGNLKVATLEQHFQELYGIGCQVLRRSGNIWLQTATTDEWTLSKQNQEGQSDSTPVED